MDAEYYGASGDVPFVEVGDFNEDGHPDIVVGMGPRNMAS